MKNENFSSSAGFTLIELLITLALVSLLSIMLVPSLQKLYTGNVASTSIQQISALVRFARNQAIMRSSTVTLCPSQNGITCSNSAWEQGVLLFTDWNKNSEVDEADIVHQYQIPFIRSGTLEWRSLRNKIHFNSRGMPAGSVGSFVYCPANKDETLAESLVISFQGRVRAGRDSNDDGIKETGSQKNIHCS